MNGRRTIPNTGIYLKIKKMKLLEMILHGKLTLLILQASGHTTICLIRRWKTERMVWDQKEEEEKAKEVVIVVKT